MIIAISAMPLLDTSELAKTLAAEHKLEIYEDPAPAICRQYGFQTLYEIPTSLQLEVREQLVVEHAELLQTGEDLLLNYSVFGFLADWMRWAWGSTPTEKWDNIKRISAVSASRYEAVYHLNNGPVREYDGYVWFDRRNAEQINSLLKYLYRELNIVDRLKEI
jgi:hypothetical protein